MPTVKLPIHKPPSQNTDELGLKGFGAQLYDGYIDPMGNIVRRPGLVELADVGTSAAIDGLYWWDEEEIALVVSNAETHKITKSDGTNAQITGDYFEKGTRPIFANYHPTIYAANGGKIISVTTSAVTEMADTDAPQTVTHVAALDTYLLANEVDTGKMHYSYVAAPTDWRGYYITAEAQYDNVVAMAVADMEINLVGKRSWEVWRNDGDTPFSRELQGYVERGTISPYSLTRCNNIWYWLDQYRQVCRLEGRTPVVVSASLQKYLNAFSQVTDALGDYVMINGIPFYVLTFKGEGETIALDLQSGAWYNWGYWDINNAVHNHWRGNCACVCPAWNMVLIGDHSNGKVYYLDADVYTDNDGTLKTLVRTEHINHGTESKRKFCRRLVLRVKRTNVANAAAAVSMYCRYRDDGKTSWVTEKEITLGQVGDTEFIGKVNMLGSYHSRQWEFYVTGSAALMIASIEETFDWGR
jgi:hypothetical protein